MTDTGISSENLGKTWTMERVDQLRSCFNAGLSCGQIAHEIGVSRNAVIGKINRLGLSRSRSTSAPRTHGTPMRRPHVLTQRLALKALFASEPVVDDVVSSEPCSLLNLAPRKCRWPITAAALPNSPFAATSQPATFPIARAMPAWRTACHHSALGLLAPLAN